MIFSCLIICSNTLEYTYIPTYTPHATGYTQPVGHNEEAYYVALWRCRCAHTYYHHHRIDAPRCTEPPFHTGAALNWKIIIINNEIDRRRNCWCTAHRLLITFFRYENKLETKSSPNGNSNSNWSGPRALACSQFVSQKYVYEKWISKWPLLLRSRLSIDWDWKSLCCWPAIGKCVEIICGQLASVRMPNNAHTHHHTTRYACTYIIPNHNSMRFNTWRNNRINWTFIHTSTNGNQFNAFARTSK